MERSHGKPIDRRESGIPFVNFVPFVVQSCDLTSILLQRNEINHEGTRCPIMVWFCVRPIGRG